MLICLQTFSPKKGLGTLRIWRCPSHAQRRRQRDQANDSMMFHDVSMFQEGNGTRWILDHGLSKRSAKFAALGLWTSLKYLMVPPLGTKAMQIQRCLLRNVAPGCPGMPRDALLQPMAGVWDGSLISCAPPSRRQRRRELMVCKWKRQRWQRLL